RSAVQNDPGAPANTFRFAGELYDSATGLYDLRAREYDPATGRFLSTDPLAPDLSEPSLSAYVYASQRPTLYIDPSGLRGGIWGLAVDWATAPYRDVSGGLASIWSGHVDTWACARAGVDAAAIAAGGFAARGGARAIRARRAAEET